MWAPPLKSVFKLSRCPTLKCYHILICDREEPLGLWEVQEEMRSNRALISLKLSAHTSSTVVGNPSSDTLSRHWDEMEQLPVTLKCSPHMFLFFWKSLRVQSNFQWQNADKELLQCIFLWCPGATWWAHVRKTTCSMYVRPFSSTLLLPSSGYPCTYPEICSI